MSRSTHPKIATMIRPFRIATIAALLACWPIGQARAAIDCPLRDQRYSVDSPLVDILLSPRATAAARAASPALIDAIPPFSRQTRAPTFGAILSLRAVATMAGPAHIDLPAVDAALHRIAPRAADRIARCERYDTDRPAFAPAARRPRILLFEKINGFRDGPSVDAAHRAIVALAARRGWTVASTDRAGVMTPDQLAQFDLVLWNNVSGDVLTLSQRKAFRAYVERGGGFVGIHGAAGDPVWFWDWYVDTLIGARFIGHPASPQFQEARLRVDDAGTAITRGLPREWRMTDEWYSFAVSPRRTGAHVLLTIDEASYAPVGYAGKDVRMGSDHPLAWTRCVGDGRAFYSAIGHRPEVYADADALRLLEQGMAWAMGRGGSRCRAGREISSGHRR